MAEKKQEQRRSTSKTRLDGYHWITDLTGGREQPEPARPDKEKGGTR